MTASTCNNFTRFNNNNNKIEQYFAPSRKPRTIQKAKRCLFGGVDHEFNDQWVNEELTKQIIHYSIKYSIDMSEGRLPELRGLDAMRPLKRRCTTFDLNENSQYYFEPIEPDREKITITTKCSKKNNNNNQSNTSSTTTTTDNHNNRKMAMKQSLLTDFMQSKKSIEIPSIKSTSAAIERPTKKPKLADCSS